MATTFIELELKGIEKSYGKSLNHWVDGLMQITFQVCYDILYFTMCLSGYMNDPTKPTFLDFKHCMEYPMEHQYTPIL